MLAAKASNKRELKNLKKHPSDDLGDKPVQFRNFHLSVTKKEGDFAILHRTKKEMEKRRREESRREEIQGF
jgi:hypothetical protein